MPGEIQIAAVTGLSPMIQLYNQLGVAVGAPFAATEIGTTGEYLADMPPNTPSSHYLILAYVGTDVKIASAECYWDGSNEVLLSLAMLQGLDPNSIMTVTPLARTAGNVNLVIGGDGTTISTVQKV